MRIRMGNKDGRGFTIVLPVGLLATRAGAAIAAHMVGRRLDGRITPEQMRQLGRMLRTSAAILRTSGLPLLEGQDQDGEWVKIEL